MTGAVSQKQYPQGDRPELAFAGRSNVGKSSLINSLLNRKKLVKTSSTPGKTQMINFFNVNDLLVFADLPGYGFAKVPESVKKHWQEMIETYLLQRENLRGVIFIIDIRRDPVALDIELRDWMEASGINYILAATKADKLSKGERDKQLRKIKAAYFVGGQGDLVVYSSVTHEGRKELLGWILKQADLNKTETNETGE